MNKLDPARIVDWRVAFQYTIASVSPGGMGKPGDVIIPMAEARARSHGKVLVPRTSPFRLGLTISIRAAQHAQELWKQISFQRGVKSGQPKLMEGQIGPIYDYYEQCMIAASFAFQGLEGYINSVIEEKLQGTFRITRGEGSALEGGVEMIQRYASTEDKLLQVLPHLLSVTAPARSSKTWSGYRALKAVRDGTIHPKQSDESSVFARFLHHEPTDYPRNALDVMAHYHDPEQTEWLRIARKMLSSPIQKRG